MERFKIYDGRFSFWQWDLEQKIIVPDGVGNEVHFSNEKCTKTPVCDVYEQDGVRLVNVPNFLLQDALPLTVYAYARDDKGERTTYADVFSVTTRPKPDDYVYAETEIRTWKDLDERITALEKIGGVDPEAVKDAVEDYLAENPIIETDPTVPEWAKKPEKPTYTPEEIGAQPAGDYVSRDEIPDIPSALPNPHKLTFTGAVSAEYDGSEAVEVEIPAVGGADVVKTTYQVLTRQQMDTARYNIDAASVEDVTKRTEYDGFVDEDVTSTLTIEDGYYYGKSLTKLEYKDLACTSLIPVKSGDKFKITSVYGYYAPLVAEFDSTKTMVSYNAQKDGESVSVADYEYTVPSGISYIAINNRYQGASPMVVKKVVVDSVKHRIAELEKGGVGGTGVTDEQVKNAVYDYLTENPVKVEETDPTVPDWAKQPEKPTYTAQEVGAMPSDTEIPTVPGVLPNPHKLTFTGAVSAEYDGSEAVEVEIPAGGGGGAKATKLITLVDITAETDIKVAMDDTDDLYFGDAVIQHRHFFYKTPEGEQLKAKRIYGYIHSPTAMSILASCSFIAYYADGDPNAWNFGDAGTITNLTNSGVVNVAANNYFIFNISSDMKRASSGTTGNLSWQKIGRLSESYNAMDKIFPHISGVKISISSGGFVLLPAGARFVLKAEVEVDA